MVRWGSQLTAAVCVGCICMLFLAYQSLDSTGAISLLQDSAGPPDQDDMWSATAALGPTGEGGKLPNPSDVGPSASAPEFSESRGRGTSVLGDDEQHSDAETFIDKHIYPPWPTDPDRARNSVVEDKISEGELAARLSRAIDRHEKCRRHWPHLERLEAAQEIRVRDARNNLEVANRGIERARKELIDAENLVMAARQEHQVYEQKRAAFTTVRKEYLTGHSYVNQNRAAMKQNLDRRNRELAILKQKSSAVAKLHAKEVQLATQEDELKQETEQDKIELAQEEAPTLAANGGEALKIVKGQQLAMLPKQMKSPKSKPVSSKPRVVPRVSIQTAVNRLKLRAKQISAQEEADFKKLPGQEAQVRKFQMELGSQRQELSAQIAKIAVAKKRIWNDRARGSSDRILKLDKQKLQLAKVNAAIMHKELKQKAAAMQKLEAEEKEAPKLSREVSLIRRKIHSLDSHLGHMKALQAAGVQLSPRQEGREMELAVLPKSMTQKPRKAVYRSPVELKAHMRSMRSKLKNIDSRLLSVRTRLAAQRQEVAVDEEKLQSRTHELSRSTRLVQQLSEDPKMAGISLLYQEKLRDVREERRKADGLLAKAERMLNIARIDTRNSARSKKAALEELSYATHKLRKYQDLRAKSQRCQMEAWSEIRHLTHNARDRRMLEG